MNEFIARYQDQISGVLTGFDRLMFRGNLALNHEAGMKGRLWAKGIAWKNYAAHVTLVSQRVSGLRWPPWKPVIAPSVIGPTAKTARKRWREPSRDRMALRADRCALLQP